MRPTMKTLSSVAALLLCGSCPAKDKEAAPPPQRPRYSYTEHEVTFRNELAGITLAGTLALPDSNRLLAAVVLIPNSSCDRDETWGRHRPLRVLSTHLAQEGLVVLRVDSRGIGRSEGKAWPAITKRDMASDVEAAMGYLRGRPDVGSLRIGLIGHSEGANVATIVAGRSPEVSFVVMLGGPGLPGEEVLCQQIRRVAKAFGVADSSIDKVVHLLRESTRVLQGQPEEDKARADLERLFEDYLSKTTASERAGLAKSGYSTPDKPADYAAGVSLFPWMKDFLLYDPRSDLGRVRCPVLSLIGEKDMQVDADLNNAALRAALEKAGNRQGTFKKLSGLNHLLQTAPTGSPAEYQQIAETISPVALDPISQWITAQLRQTPQFPLER